MSHPKALHDAHSHPKSQKRNRDGKKQNADLLGHFDMDLKKVFMGTGV